MTVKDQLKNLWKDIELDALRAENYLENPTAPHKGAHTVLAKQVKENVNKILKLMKP